MKHCDEVVYLLSHGTSPLAWQDSMVTANRATEGEQKMAPKKQSSKKATTKRNAKKKRAGEVGEDNTAPRQTALHTGCGARDVVAMTPEMFVKEMERLEEAAGDPNGAAPPLKPLRLLAEISGRSAVWGAGTAAVVRDALVRPAPRVATTGECVLLALRALTEFCSGLAWMFDVDRHALLCTDAVRGCVMQLARCVSNADEVKQLSELLRVLMSSNATVDFCTVELLPIVTTSACCESFCDVIVASIERPDIALMLSRNEALRNALLMAVVKMARVAKSADSVTRLSQLVWNITSISRCRPIWLVAQHELRCALVDISKYAATRDSVMSCAVQYHR